ncbi:MAG: hypothetical protein ucyna2_00773 [Candidatus Atelocyanobacterium thalassa isolate SIO64986]|uniref:Uncharacterized protein n=1 Tax=Candidatus Atelocyanobacterium thalassa isolate SIO64986 TaxID=1527444 RepID=A0A086CGN7_9CHRO|nr:MAG: hypothetical protein ucyna2_00773 [Candidatus Atelocyanobacterium thalassa isolate SIO64986]
MILDIQKYFFAFTYMKCIIYPINYLTLNIAYKEKIILIFSL